MCNSEVALSYGKCVVHYDNGAAEHNGWVSETHSSRYTAAEFVVGSPILELLLQLLQLWKCELILLV